jgi:tetratricopeptide (TPR) repeat protein
MRPQLSRPPYARARRLLLVALWLAACASPEERFAEHVARAEAHIEAGRIRDALIEYQSALKIDPASAQVNWRLGELLSDAKAYQAAAFHLGEAYRLDPNRVEAVLWQVSLIWRSSPQRAQQILEEVMQRHPDDARVYRTESALALVRGDRRAALAAVGRALELDPDDAESWTQLGAVHLARIRSALRRDAIPRDALYEDALEAFDRVETLEGGHVGARLEKARVYASWDGHSQQADDAYRAAVELARERANPQHWLAAALAMDEYARGAGRHSLRVYALRQAVDADPKRIRSWEKLARVTEQIEGPEQAERIYLELVEQQPQRPASHIAYTSHLARQRRGLDAIAHLDRVLSEGLDAAALWEQLMRLELSEGQRANARATYHRMRERHGGDSITRRSGARLAISDGRDEEALEILRELDGEEESAEVEQLRALAYLNLGDSAAATTAIERAVSLSESFPVAIKRVEASVHYEARRWSETLQTLRALEQHRHELAPAELLMRAVCFYETGRAEQGRRLLDELLGDPAVAKRAALEFARREGEEDPDAAHRELARALRHAPGSHELMVAITQLDVRSGHHERALRRLDKIIDSQLAGPQLLLLRAELLTLRGELERAEADALRAFEADPDLPGAVDLLFAIYEEQGRLAEALRAFQEAESVGVLHSGARVLLGRLYLSQGRSDEAREAYEKAIESDPGNAPAMNDLAYLLASEGRELDRALVLAEAARRALPDHPSPPDTVGYVHLRGHRYESALRAFRGAIELAEARRGEAAPTFHYHLGLALSGLERDGEAADAFARALALDPGFPDADEARRKLDEAQRAGAASSSQEE